LPTYTVVATHGAAHNQQFEVECTVPKLDVKVSGSGASRRAAEQAAAKKALDEVLAAAPMLASKPKRSKNARGSKHAEPEIVPGVKGVQEALDLRSPERKERAAARDVKASGGASEPAERPAQAPMAAIRAAHVETVADKTDRARSGAVGRQAGREVAGARRSCLHAADKPAEGAPRAADKPTGQAAGQAAVQPADPASASADKSAAASDPASARRRARATAQRPTPRRRRAARASRPPRRARPMPATELPIDRAARRAAGCEPVSQTI
jgi:ribonuclease-3